MKIDNRKIANWAGVDLKPYTLPGYMGHATHTPSPPEYLNDRGRVSDLLNVLVDKDYDVMLQSMTQQGKKGFGCVITNAIFQISVFNTNKELAILGAVLQVIDKEGLNAH